MKYTATPTGAAMKRKKYRITPNSIQDAAGELGVSTRTIWRWISQNRVEINESKTAGGKVILRKIYDASGKEIWHATTPTKGKIILQDFQKYARRTKKY